jgi:hypothetical protein
MNDSVPWIVDDDAPTTTAPLPRLQIIHLLMWMAATAVAFVPYRTMQENTRRMSPAAVDVASNPATTFLSVAAGILQGACLFAAVAVLVWQRRGYEGLPQPGHYFAYRSAALWAASIVMWGASALLPVDSPIRPILFIPYAVVGVVFFIWYLRLARRETIPRGWRRAFAVTAIAPVVAWVLTIVFVFARWTRNPGGMMGGFVFIQGLTALAVVVAIVLAILEDRSRDRVRHWSHFIGPGARLAEAAGYVLASVAMGLFMLFR